VKKIRIWNVRTLLKSRKLKILKTEMRRLELDVLDISKMRLRKLGDFWSGDYRIIYFSTKEGDRTGRNEVGLVLQ